MGTSRIFYATLAISAGIHVVILFQNPNFTPFSFQQKEQNVKISYVKAVAAVKQAVQARTVKNDPFLRIPPKITTSESRILPPTEQRNAIFKANKASLTPPELLMKPAALAKPDVVSVAKKIAMAPLKTEKGQSPSYLAHSELLRETIKRALRLIYSGSETGEIRVAFVIAKDGNLKDVHILENGSSPSPHLRELALRGIKQAAPYAPFPKELDYPQLSYSEEISFQISSTEE